jgi:nuclear pore complex protein Nup98-Nup96
VLHDPVAEARWLVEGDELLLAHDVLCRTIGPAAVVEDDFGALREVVGALRATEVSRLEEWEKGAGLYEDYVALLDLQGSSKKIADSKALVKKLIRKLSASLEAIAPEMNERGVMEKIAVKIMAGKVVEVGNREGVS